MSESTQKKLDRVRPPRVQITYDVHIGDAFEKKELPLLVGIMADLSGKREQPLPKVKKRKFVEIDRDNINDVLAAAAPRLAFQVPNKLQEDAGKLNVLLNFNEMDDFEPVQVLKQVPVLARLYEARLHLRDLLGKLDGNDELSSLLNDVLQNTEQQTQLKALLNSGDAGAEGAAGDAAPATE
jgi:type VI secretion system protein ImpB